MLLIYILQKRNVGERGILYQDRLACNISGPMVPSVSVTLASKVREFSTRFLLR